MGIGFKLNLKWDFSVKSPFFINSSSGPSSYSFRGREASYDSARVSFPSVISGESETLHNGPLRAHTCSSSPQTLENDYSEIEGIKMNISKRSHGGLYNVIDDNIQMSHGGDKLTFLTSLQAYKASHFSLLIKNLDMLEEMFDDSDVIRLERDIMAQLERLGALKLFRIFLSRSLKAPDMVDSAHTSNEFIDETQMNDGVDNQTAMIVVRTGKKEERITRRQKASENAINLYAVALPSKTNEHHKRLNFSSASRSSNSRGRRLKIGRNEVEMARGVKMLVSLERIRTVLEKESGQVATLSRWAEAAALNKKELQENLHYGWYCRDELLRSARSLVLYLARNYRGVGVAFEDLIQAGNFGVMQGAERFDHTRGYKFSTYVQYWIRKSMSILVTQHARGIRIPFTLSKAINQIQKARKVLHNSHGKYPGDDEIAKLTGLSLAKITSASKCMRVVGSLDQKVGEFTSAMFLELTPDKSIKSPEESVARQHMIKDIYALLNCLDPRERQVLVLRFGLEDHQRKSLEEIGRLFNVSKEWIRKIERTALGKLRDEETCRNLSHYLYM